MADKSAAKKEAKRPLPSLHELDTAPFWRATNDGQLTYQKCDDCGTIVFYPRAHCTGCTSGNLSTQVASGKGTVYTYSVVRQSYHPFFRQLVPYVVAWIDLEEGPRIMSNVLGVDEPSPELIGRAVQLEWEQHEELAVPLFRVV